MFNYIMSDEQNRNTVHLLIDGKNIWFGIMTYGPSAARSFLHDPEPNIFRTNPTKLGQ